VPVSVAIELTVSGLDGVEALLARLANPDIAQLLDEIGALVVSQTQSRLTDEKAGPDGEAWPEWSEKYARTRHGGQSLLMAEGNPGLLSSITHLVHGGGVEVGSHLVYAAHHQFGSQKSSGRGSGVPARAFLGLSAANEDEIERVIDGFIERMLK
jgi:phage virion morphogenesis protein